MAWPYSALLPIRQELYIDGAWVDITDDTRGSQREITITRGYSQQQTALGAGQISFYLNNADGKYSPRNPTGPYWGLLPRNVPHRCSIALATTSLRLTDTSTVTTGDYDGARAWTADKASLDITGDIDVRIDCEADDWYGRMGHILASKYSTVSNQRSWVFATTPLGYLQLIWTTDGTAATRNIIRSTATIEPRGRQTFKVTLDVNNGAGGNTVTFYTSDSVTGTFTQLGSPVVTTGATSIFSSSAKLQMGTATEDANRGAFTGSADCDPFTGKIYRCQVRSSIGGTVVADMDATAQARGTTSWSDGLTSPNTWTLEASAEITDADYRMHSQIYEFPSEWDPTGSDVYVNILAMDKVEQLTSGEKALDSPIFYNLSHQAPDGYWPLESGATDPSQIGAYAGLTGAVTDGAFSTATDLPGTGGALSFTTDSGAASGNAGTTGAATGTSFFLWYFKMANLPAGTVDFFHTYYTGGNVYRAFLQCSSTAFTLHIQNASGADLDALTVSFGAGAEPTQWLAMRLLMTQSGGTASWELAWYPIGGAVAFGTSGSFAGTFGKPTRWIAWPYTGKSDLQIAHVFLSRTDPGFTTSNFIGSTNGYIGESARERAVRICAQKSIPFWWIGPQTIDSEDASVPMGVQTQKTATDLLQECADADGGILFSPRDKLGLCIRSYYSLLNRGWPELDYTAQHLSGQLRPRELRDIRNDVTITRTGGSFGRAVKEDGPNGITLAGTYDVSIPRSASRDDQLVPMAEREALIWTWDEARQTVVQVELHRAELVADSALSAEVAALDVGTPVALTNLPAYAGGPDDAVLLALGYTETLANITRTLSYNTVPYGPYLTGIYGGARRYGAKFTTLGSGVNSSATTLSFAISDDRETWSTTAVPYDVIIAGERITVTAMAGVSGGAQSATVTRSVNGVVKALDADEVVQIWMPARYAMRPRGPQ